MRQRIVTTAEIQKLDRLAIRDYGIPSLVLMENAGRSVAAAVQALVKGKLTTRVTIVCGTGNNGGDGFVAARRLWNAGIPVSVFLVGSPRQLKNDAAVNYRILKRCGYAVAVVNSSSVVLKNSLRRSGVIVDALFGVGLNRTIREPVLGIIQLINAAKAVVVAVDVPSGLDATTGKIWGTAVKADATITFTFAKKGFFVREGLRYTGKIRVVDIGIPMGRINNVKRKVQN